MEYLDAKMVLMEQRKLQRATYRKDKKAMMRQVKANSRNRRGQG